MDTLTSADGATIAFDRSGDGPPLILVVGAFCDRSTTEGLAPLLAQSHRVFEYDRRGRGSSTDAAAYSVEREIEDLEALVEVAGGSAAVYGHSSGGALALEAAARGAAITKLAVYEPPYTADANGDGGSGELLDGVTRLVAAGDKDGAAELFLQNTGMPPEVLAMIQSGPGWPRMRDLAPALVYDLTLGNEGSAPVERLATIGIPTLAIAGGASPPWAATAAASVAAAVPGARQMTLEGQTHAVAHEAVAPVLLEYFGE